MRAGKLDRRITFLRAAIGRDRLNNEVPTWPPFMTVWASWRPATAREQLAQQEIGAEAEDIFEIRWSNQAATINPKDRLQFKGRDYDIAEVTEIGRREGIRIKASARAD